jgi:hypothetical protein
MKMDTSGLIFKVLSIGGSKMLILAGRFTNKFSCHPMVRCFASIHKGPPCSPIRH